MARLGDLVEMGAEKSLYDQNAVIDFELRQWQARTKRNLLIELIFALFVGCTDRNLNCSHILGSIFGSKKLSF